MPGGNRVVEGAGGAQEAGYWLGRRLPWAWAVGALEAWRAASLLGKRLVSQAKKGTASCFLPGQPWGGAAAEGSGDCQLLPVWLGLRCLPLPHLLPLDPLVTGQVRGVDWEERAQLKAPGLHGMWLPESSAPLQLPWLSVFLHSQKELGDTVAGVLRAKVPGRGLVSLQLGICLSQQRGVAGPNLEARL